jgi:hypothetical protein
MTRLGLMPGVGATPMEDSLVQKYGPVGAVVFGIVWRYTKGNNGICVASQKAIGDKAKLSATTIRRWLKTLVEDGYLKLVDNPVPYSTKAYRDTGKVVINMDEEDVKACLLLA